MSLDDATVRRIGKLARLHIEEHEVPMLREQLSGILGWIEQLNEVDVSGVPALAGVTGLTLRLRDDVIATDLTGGGRPDAILANAPERAGHFFTVPKVIE